MRQVRSFIHQIFVGLVLILGVACQSTHSSNNKREAIQVNCYSPDTHLENAYIEGAEGCACAVGTPSVCKNRRTTGLERDVALVCSEGKWVAVLDGPCGIEPPVDVVP